MNRIIELLIFGIQLALTFMATFCIYMLFALLDNDFCIDGLFGLFIMQPIMAIILSGLTIFVCLVVGLPIRLNNKLNIWWTTNFYISFIGVFFGLAFLILAFLPFFQETVTAEINGEPTLKQIPNLTFLAIGWFATAFFILHIYPPGQLTEKVKGIIQGILKVSLGAENSENKKQHNNFRNSEK